MKLTGDHCQCSACGEYFNSTKGFDRHRLWTALVGDYTGRRCRSVDEMLVRGMSKNARGFWITQKMADSTAALRHSSRDLTDPL